MNTELLEEFLKILSDYGADGDALSLISAAIDGDLTDEQLLKKLKELK